MPLPQVFDQAELLKYTADEAIAKFGNAFPDILNRKPEGEQARIFNLQAIVKQSNTDWSATLSVVCMNNRVHDRFAHRDNGKGPEIGAFHRSDNRFVLHVLPQKRNHFLSRSRKISANFR
jgi:hypothetical protein